MGALKGIQKITTGEAREIHTRLASWQGPQAAFVAAEALRYRVGRETIRRLLRGETHVDALPQFAALAPAAAPPAAPAVPAFPWAGTPTPAPFPDPETEASAQRLLDALRTPSGDAVVDAIREELGGPAPEVTP